MFLVPLQELYSVFKGSYRYLTSSYRYSRAATVTSRAATVTHEQLPLPHEQPPLPNEQLPLPQALPLLKGARKKRKDFNKKSNLYQTLEQGYFWQGCFCHRKKTTPFFYVP